jgi:hypothetical protein
VRSVLVVIGGRIHHLRYPIAAIEDIDQVLPDGFLSVFDREADVQTCHLLLWAGLQHDATTYEGAGRMLIREGAVYDPIVLMGFWKRITDALMNDEWVDITRSDGTGAPQTLKEYILEMERIAVAEMDMNPVEFYGITPREFRILRENHGLRANRRAGLICATMANIHARGKDDPVFTPKDFIRTGEVTRPQTAEEQAAVLAGVFS